MRFDEPLREAVLVRRYKRFLADVRLPGGQVMTVHCPNPGSMLGLATPGSRVLISDSHNPKRKLRHTLEMVEAGGALVGVHTGRANAVAGEAIGAGAIKALTGYAQMRAEVPYGDASRIDFLLQGPGRHDCYVEVKSVTLSRTPGLAEFPDSVSTRAHRHLRALAAMVADGHRAAVLFVVQREDCQRFAPARDLDPGFALGLQEARRNGVAMMAHACTLDAMGIQLGEAVAFT